MKCSSVWAYSVILEVKMTYKMIFNICVYWQLGVIKYTTKTKKDITYFKKRFNVLISED